MQTKLTLTSYTNDKGIVMYGVTVNDTTPAMASTPNKKLALQTLNRLALDATIRGRKTVFARWDGDLGAETSLFPDFTAVIR